MSTEASAPTKETPEQAVEVQQESLQSSDQKPVEEKADVERIKENVEDGTERAGSAAAGDTSDITAADENTKLQPGVQEGITIGSAGIQDSQESPISGDGSGTESQQSSATGGVSRQLSQTSAPSAVGSGTESQRGGHNGTELQLLGAVGGSCRLDSSDSTTADGSSTTDSSYKTAHAGDSDGPSSLESAVGGGVFNIQDSQVGSNVTGSWEGISPPAPPLSATSGDASRSSRQSPEVVLRRNEDEREVRPEEVGRNYEQCLSCCAFACDYLAPCARFIRKSRIFRFLSKLILLILSISAWGMGSVYTTPSSNAMKS